MSLTVDGGGDCWTMALGAIRVMVMVPMDPLMGGGTVYPTNFPHHSTCTETTTGKEM